MGVLLDHTTKGKDADTCKFVPYASNQIDSK